MPEFDFDALGINTDWFSSLELPDLLGGQTNPNQDDEAADIIPEVEEEPITKLGELWQLGNHRLLCGDATKREDVERLLNGEKADMVFTDPPYNMDYQDLKRNFKKITNDKMDDSNFINFLTSSLSTIPTQSYICCNWMFYHLFKVALERIQHPVKACIVWDKVTRTQNLDKYYKQHEFILYTGKLGGEQTIRGDVWQLQRQTSDLHPTVKPVELVMMAISDNPKTKSVMDLFGGSGSTLIACEKLNRQCLMMELDPHYCDVIVKRWEQYTGKQARLIG